MENEDTGFSVRKSVSTNFELKSLRLETLASISKSYTDIYKKYGYPTFKISTKSTGETLVQLDESDYFDDSAIKACLLKDDNKSQCSLPCISTTRSLQANVRSIAKAQTSGETSPIIGIGKGIFIKKSKKKRVLICTTHCRYSIIPRVAACLGMREVLETDPWAFMWMDTPITVDKVRHMKRFQRINHFPGMMEICRKDLLARNLNRMRKSFPDDYNFFPHTWSLPFELNDALKYSKRNKSKTFILKPECSSQGKGIFLVKNLRDLHRITEKFICQHYITKPYTIDGFKFDIRIYTLISSCDPLRVYVYKEGLVRFATQRYALPDCKNAANQFIHLTNFSINRRSANFVHDQYKGSKRKISAMNSILQSRGIDIDSVWLEIDRCIVKTIIAGWPMIRHNYKACFPIHDSMSACFEILGFDILLDYKLKPWILEVNHSPSFHTDTPIDREVKESLLKDTFQLLNVCGCDSRRMIDEDRKRTRERLCLGKGHSKTSTEDKDNQNSVNKSTNQEIWEMNHLGNFRRVYPSDTVNYGQFFNQKAGSLYTTTESVRRKADLAKQLRNELAESKSKYETHKKPFNLNCKENSETSQSSMVSSGNKNLVDPSKESKTEPVVNPKKPFVVNAKENSDLPQCSKITPIIKDCIDASKESKKFQLKSPRLCDMFEPVPYVEVDDRKRSSLMQSRDSLLKTYGITRLVYKLMKHIGTLRDVDVRKYGTFEKVGNTPSKSQLFDINNNQSSSTSLKFGLSANKLMLNNANMSNTLNKNIDPLDSLSGFGKFAAKISWPESQRHLQEYDESLQVMRKTLKPIKEQCDLTSNSDLIVKTLINSVTSRRRL